MSEGYIQDAPNASSTKLFRPGQYYFPEGKPRPVLKQKMFSCAYINTCLFCRHVMQATSHAEQTAF